METYKTGKDSVFWTADDGEWVPADVAQGLYDALSEMAYECDLNDLSMRMQSYDQAMDALAAADGEEV